MRDEKKIDKSVIAIGKTDAGEDKSLEEWKMREEEN